MNSLKVSKLKPILIIIAIATQILVSSKVTKAANQTLPADSAIYKTTTLIINKLSSHCYQHLSYFNTEDYGKVECNGMIVIDGNEAIVFDTPADNQSSEELINYVTKKMNVKIKAIIPTHFHEDCVGGLKMFDQFNIPSYASNQTIELLKSKTKTNTSRIKGFDKNLDLKVGNLKVYARYFGEGHTKDNIIGYVPADQAMFGGCLIKEVDASKGYLGDANVKEWSQTVKKVKQKFPDAKIIIPGHGNIGGTELLDYTVKLFKDTIK